MFGFFTSKVTPDDEEFEERAEDSYQIAGIIAKKIGEVRYVSAQMEYAKLDYYMKYKHEHFQQMGATDAPIGTRMSYVLSVLYRYEHIFYFGYRGMFSKLDYVNMETEIDITDVQMHMMVGGYETDFKTKKYGPFPRWLYITAELGLGGGENEFIGVQLGGTLMYGMGLQYKFETDGGYLGFRGGYKRQFIGIGSVIEGAELKYGGPFIYFELGF